MTDTEYIKIFHESPEKAQRLLFDEYYNYVYNIVFSKLRKTASNEDIEECVSDVFSDVFIYCDEMSCRNGDLKGIIATISTRKAINMFHSLSSAYGRTVSFDDDTVPVLSDDTQIEKEAEDTEIRDS